MDVIPLEGCTTQSCGDDGKRFGFELITPKRSTTWWAPSLADREEWMRKIQDIKIQARQESRRSTSTLPVKEEFSGGIASAVASIAVNIDEVAATTQELAPPQRASKRLDFVRDALLMHGENIEQTRQQVDKQQSRLAIVKSSLCVRKYAHVNHCLLTKQGGLADEDQSCRRPHSELGPSLVCVDGPSVALLQEQERSSDC